MKLKKTTQWCRYVLQCRQTCFTSSDINNISDEETRGWLTSYSPSANSKWFYYIQRNFVQKVVNNVSVVMNKKNFDPSIQRLYSYALHCVFRRLFYPTFHYSMGKAIRYLVNKLTQEASKRDYRGRCYLRK